MKRLTGAVVAALALLAGANVYAAGDELFNKHCSTCHGKDGKAGTKMGQALKAKDLTSAEIKAKSDADYEKQMMTGTKGPDGKERMPSFKEKLQPGEVKEIVKYVRDLK